MFADSAFKAPLIRLMAQNPAIDLEDWLRHDVEEVASATGTQGRLLTTSSAGSRVRADLRGTWFLPVVGAVIGLALGILVSVTTGVPFAPEVGLLLGALAGWLSRRVST
jgi:hypothetical protein